MINQDVTPRDRSARSNRAHLRILAICGSLRTASYNLAALAVLPELSPPDFAVQILRLLEIPMFNQDALDAHGYPPEVQRFRADLVAADGIVIATPEYNYSVPGVLKNALDWLAGKPSLIAGKPVTVFSVAPNPIGGSRAQLDLRKILQALGALVLAQPETTIGLAREKFDVAGGLTDETARAALAAQMAAFREWILLLQPPLVISA